MHYRFRKSILILAVNYFKSRSITLTLKRNLSLRLVGQNGYDKSSDFDVVDVLDLTKSKQFVNNCLFFAQ